MYENDPHAIPASRSSLFNKPLLIFLQSPSQKLQSWLQSITEAIATQSHRDTMTNQPERELMRKFFLPKTKVSNPLPVKHISLPSRVKPKASTTSVMRKQPPQKPFRSLFILCCHAHYRTTTASDKSLLAPVFRTLSQPRKLTPTTRLRPATNQLNKLLSLSPMSLTRQKSCKSLINRTWRQRKLGTASTKTVPTRSKPRRRLLKAKSLVSVQRTLISYGFLPSVKRSQADCEARMLDYSGSLVSTTP
jgi:hypothetical protein